MNFRSRILQTVSIGLLTFLPALAHAGFLFEPSINYQMNKLSVTNPTTGTGSQDETVDGAGIGLRLGWRIIEMIDVGVDARYMVPSYDSEALNGSGSAVGTNFGATVGVQTPFIGLRLWGTYLFDGILDPDTVNGNNLKYTGLTGYRLGVGFFIAVVSLNLEYQEASYNSADLEGAGTVSPGAASNMDGTQKGMILGVSFPMNF